MQVHRLTEFSIYLDQRPGELAGLLDVFAAAGADVCSMCVTEHNGRGLVRVIGEPAEAMRSQLEPLADRGIGPIVEAEVLTADIDKRPSVLRDLSTTLAEHGINVRYGYFCPPRSGIGTRYVFRVDDLEEAERALADVDH